MVDEDSRPVVSKPKLEQWHNDDNDLARLLDHLKNKVLNVDEWRFRIAHLNKEVSYEEVLKNIQERYPSFEWVEALKDSFKFLPDKFRVIQDDLFSVFKRFTLNLQERANYADQISKYADELEDEVKGLRSERDRLKKRLDEAYIISRDEVKKLIAVLEVPATAPVEKEDVHTDIQPPVPPKGYREEAGDDLPVDELPAPADRWRKER